MGDKHAERAALLILKEAMPELTQHHKGANPQRRNIRSHAWLTSDSTSDGWRKESARHGQERTLLQMRNPLSGLPRCVHEVRGVGFDKGEAAAGCAERERS